MQQSANLHRMSIAAIFCAVCLHAWNPVYGYSDLFGHAAIGRWIAEHHAVPRSTLFLWSAHAPYIAHSWLSELLLYRLMTVSSDAVGVTLCVGIAALAIAGSFSVLWSSRRDTPHALPMLFGIAIVADSLRFQPRPEAFTDLLLAALLAFLCRYRSLRISDGQPGRITVLSFAGIAALFALWTNLHGSVALGLLLMAVTCVCDGVQSRFDAKTLRLIGLCVCCVAATVCNPYGLGYIAVYRHIDSRVFAQIEEWFPIYKYPLLSPAVMSAEALLTAAAAWALARSPDRRLAHIVWLVLGIAMFVTARRNLLVLTFICLAVACEYSARFIEMESGIAERLQRLYPAATPARKRLIITAVHCLFWIFVFTRADIVTRTHPLTLFSAANVPEHQADYLCRSGITGRLFNDYNCASYFEWRLYGHNTFFVDDVNAYGDEIMKPWYDVLFKADDDGMAYLATNHVNCVVGRNRQPGETDFPVLYYRLTHDPQWSLVYFANDGPIWVRKIREYHGILGKRLVTSFSSL